MREIRLHDTLSGARKALEPRVPGRVGIYACGPTVYAPVHVGNARPYVVFSLLKRFLEHEGYEATLVINVTDINDKIYDAAHAAGVSSTELAGQMTARYLEDTDRLDLGRPDHEPSAAESIGPIVGLVEALIDSGHAYPARGDVYFRVSSFDRYGKLSNRPQAELVQGEGDDAGELKEDPRDFALWKARKQGEDSAWPAPWGEGRPGWHIECSAMAEQILGTDFEIHGGGGDLVFPHHENEIAQTEAGRGRPLARIWMHNGMVQMGGEKMAKSGANIRVLRAALDEYGRDALVTYLAAGHYHQPLAFSAEALAEAGRAVERVRELCRRLDPEGPQPEGLDAYAERFFDALAEDFNTPAARSVLFEWVREANRRLDAGERMGPGRLREVLHALALEGLLEDADPGGPDAEARHLLEEREAARVGRDFERADRLRDELAGRGWEVRDTPQGARLLRSP